MPLLDVRKPKQQALEFVFPRTRPLHTIPSRMNRLIEHPRAPALGRCAMALGVSEEPESLWTPRVPILLSGINPLICEWKFGVLLPGASGNFGVQVPRLGCSSSRCRYPQCNGPWPRIQQLT